VNLVAATQRPTQKAMGQGAVRSQMDVRISFRVRERKDVDLILGQGMLAAGWHAHTLNAPGKFLVAAAEHDTPNRARAYLITDEAVATTAATYADFRPPLDGISRQALTQDHWTERNLPSLLPAPVSVDDEEDRDNAPEVVLWAALMVAPPEGTTVPDLVTETGMSRPWVYLRLRELSDRGQVIQVSRGRWRAIPSDTEPD
jgi:S-DNA-T family DNA segregation ATPase FtsK/SpoIIIE